MDLSGKVDVVADAFSKKAIEKIEAAGGTATVAEQAAPAAADAASDDAATSADSDES